MNSTPGIIPIPNPRKIPRIIHQIWIGPLPRPEAMMNTWREKNPGSTYILWDEKRIAQYLHPARCQAQIDTIAEINGKADIYRWEILYQYGGLFFDADSVCLETLPDFFYDVPEGAFSCLENEIMRQGLVACGAMGATARHPLIGKVVDAIQKSPDVQRKLITTRAWYSVGPGLLTDVLLANPRSMTLFPSHVFYPRHHTGLMYEGHGRVFAHQFWGTNDHNYDQLMNPQVPPELTTPPTEWVSVIVANYETPLNFVAECLDSIREQVGYFGIELVWVDDGSSPEHVRETTTLLSQLEKMSRWITIKMFENEKNLGCRLALRHAVEAATHEIVFKMDADDRMHPRRIQKQLKFMQENPRVPLCGTQMTFLGQEKRTHHPVKITLHDLQQGTSPPEWFMNHPTFCFRRSAMMSVGNYPERVPATPVENMMDDYEIELKMIREFGQIANLDEPLHYYRTHPGQMTQKFPSDTREMAEWRRRIFQSVFPALPPVPPHLLSPVPVVSPQYYSALPPAVVMAATPHRNKSDPEVVVSAVAPIVPASFQEAFPGLTTGGAAAAPKRTFIYL